MDQDEAFRRVWQTFRTFDRLADGRHDTPAWRSHPGVYAICIVRVPTTELSASLDALHETLARYPHVRVHPRHFLHITLQELGFVCDKPSRAGEISKDRLDEFVSAAATHIYETRPFQMSLGGVNSFQDAAFLDVHDRGRCARLHTRLNELAAFTRTSGYAYLPHSTIAHYTADVPAANLAATLAQWRDRRFATFMVNNIEIVTLRPDEPYPPLEPYAMIPLGG